MEKILIVGLGLIGGSVAKGLGKVYALDKSEDTIKQAQQFLIKGYTSLDQVDINPEAVILCVPVSTAISMAPALKQRFASSIFIDCCSTKRGVEKAYNDCLYAGMHPMAGSEGSGFEHSRGGLFRGAAMCITGTGVAAEYAYSLAQRLEGRPMVMDAEAHDKAVAMVSHLPHIVAGALCLTAKEQAAELAITQSLAAGGFADLTRIADSDPTMWGAIFSDNADMVLQSMDRFEGVLHLWRELLISKDEQKLKDFFARCKESKQSFKRNESGIFPKGGASLFLPCDRKSVIAVAQKALELGAQGVSVQNDGITITCSQRGELEIIKNLLQKEITKK